MDGENRRSKEAVRNSIRTYGVKVMDPASLPLKKTKETESQESVSRFSERSLHSQYEMEEGCKGCCQGCLNRVPYATLIAFIICALGILFVAVADQRAAVLTRAMINDILKRDSNFISTFDVVLLLMALVTAIVAVLILVVGVLTTGDTRDEVYKAWKARIGGRIACLVLMIVTFALLFFWCLFFVGICFVIYVLVASELECDLHRAKPNEKNCLSVSFIDFLVNERNRIEICDSQEIKKFCKDFVEKAAPAYLVTFIGDGLVAIGLVLFLICLSANYARIRAQSKLQELQEMQHVGLAGNKNRF